MGWSLLVKGVLKDLTVVYDKNHHLALNYNNDRIYYFYKIFFYIKYFITIELHSTYIW